MPPVPPACQPLADEVSALETQEVQLRAQAASLTGAAAWAALATLGELRARLEERRARLAECVSDNSAALQATLAVIDVGPGGAQHTRVAHLWNITAAGSGQQGASNLTGGAFSFAGPLPPTFGLTVATTDDPTVLGPDFRSPSLTAAALADPTAVRVEVVLGPMVRLAQSDVARLTAAFNPTSSHVGAGAVEVDVSVTHIVATLITGAIVARADGLVSYRTLMGALDDSPFSASVTLHLAPVAAPGAVDLLDLWKASEVDVQMPGVAGILINSILPLVRGYVDGLLVEQLRALLRSALPAVVNRSFALTSLPADAVVSVRKLSIDASAIEFQPTLSAVGTTLSTFTPTAIPPP